MVSIKISNFLVLILVLFVPVFSQTPVPSPSPQIATTLDGKKVFLKSDWTWEYVQDTSSIPATQGSRQRTANSNVSLSALEAANDALESLSKINDAVLLGANIIELRRLVLDAKSKIRSATILLPDDGDLEKELDSSIGEYSYYITLFDKYGGKVDIPSGTEEGKLLESKYKLKPQKALFGKYFNAHEIFVAIMNSAVRHHNLATKAFNVLAIASNQSNKVRY